MKQDINITNTDIGVRHLFPPDKYVVLNIGLVSARGVYHLILVIRSPEDHLS